MTSTRGRVLPDSSAYRLLSAWTPSGSSTDTSAMVRPRRRSRLARRPAIDRQASAHITRSRTVVADRRLHTIIELPHGSHPEIRGLRTDVHDIDSNAPGDRGSIPGVPATFLKIGDDDDCPAPAGQAPGRGGQ